MKQHRQAGMTILEILLVLAIAGSMMMIGISLYQSWTTDLSARRVLANVDKLFDAMGKFYVVNCNGSFQGGLDLPQTGIYNEQYGFTRDGRLNPENPVTPADLTKAFSINIANDLINPGFLTNWVPANPLVDEGAGEAGYFVQFIPVLNQNIVVNACSDMDTQPCTLSHTPIPLTDVDGHFIPTDRMVSLMWKAVVGVHFFTPEAAQTFMRTLNATCVTTLPNPTDSITPCTTPVAATDRDVLWERLPTQGSPESRTINWVSMPLQKIFLQQYTHDQMYEMIPASRNDNDDELRYYLCGG